MTIKLSEIWKIDNPADYKLHFARWNKICHPLEAYCRSSEEWQSWQEYRPSRNEFSRPLIFSVMQFYHEPDTWLFGGIYEVIDRKPDSYTVQISNLLQNFVGRIKLCSSYRGRSTRVNFENHYSSFDVQEILRDQYSGRHFPGYDNIDLSFEELETLVINARPDWRAALQNVKGIYLITDTKTNRQYIGSAYGTSGIWSRWCDYISSGHGGNMELRQLSPDENFTYCRKNFRFSLLEYRSNYVPDEFILARESFWKRILLTRGVNGMNKN
jgi:hypothetical protein